MFRITSYTKPVPSNFFQKIDFSYPSGNIRLNLSNIERKLDVIIEILQRLRG